MTAQRKKQLCAQQSIKDLRSDPRCQARLGFTEEAVESYAAAYKDGATLPALEAFEVDGELLIVDGFHRLEAAKRAGVATLPVEVVGKGTMEEAVWEALGKNHNHGVRRTQEDKRKAVHLALRNPASAKLTNRKLAEYLDVSHTFVANERKILGNMGELSGNVAISPEVEYARKLLATEEGKELAASCRRNARTAEYWASRGHSTFMTTDPDGNTPEEMPYCLPSRVQWIRISILLNRVRREAEANGDYWQSHLNLTHVAALVARAGGCDPEPGFWRQIAKGFSTDSGLVYDDTKEQKTFFSLKDGTPKVVKRGDDPKIDALWRAGEECDIEDLQLLARHRKVVRLSRTGTR